MFPLCQPPRQCAYTGAPTMGRLNCTHLNIRTWRRAMAPRAIVAGLLCAGLSTHPARAADPVLPAVDLIVQIRVISEIELAAETAASQSPDAPPRGQAISNAVQSPVSARTQEVRVLNGRSAEVSWSQALPIQWLQAAQRRGRTSRTAEGGIVHGLTWLHVGQSLSVQPRWSGGRDPVRIELRIATQGIEEGRGSDVPASSSQTWGSTLSVPWSQWTTFATAGTAQPPSDGTTWSTRSTHAQGLQLMQLRVTRH